MPASDGHRARLALAQHLGANAQFSTFEALFAALRSIGASDGMSTLT
jgi:hypothetical protein